MIHNEMKSYDKTRDDTINICLNCTKPKCSGECDFKKIKANKQNTIDNTTNKN